MFKRLVSRLAVVAAVSGGALAVSNPALAKDYCVNTSCGGVNAGNLQAALTAAEASVDADRVFLGSGIYTATAPQGSSMTNRTVGRWRSSAPVSPMRVRRASRVRSVAEAR